MHVIHGITLKTITTLRFVVLWYTKYIKISRHQERKSTTRFAYAVFSWEKFRKYYNCIKSKFDNNACSHLWVWTKQTTPHTPVVLSTDIVDTFFIYNIRSVSFEKHIFTEMLNFLLKIYVVELRFKIHYLSSLMACWTIQNCWWVSSPRYLDFIHAPRTSQHKPLEK